MSEAPQSLDARWLGDLQRLKVEPGEVFVLQFQSVLSVEQQNCIQAQWEARMPGVKLLLVDGGARLGVVQTPNEERK